MEGCTLMKIKRIKKLRVGPYMFEVIWDKTGKTRGGSFNYTSRELIIRDDVADELLFHRLSHELMEMATLELNVRLNRPDVGDDYIFVFDHRQFDSMMYIFSGLMMQFLE